MVYISCRAYRIDCLPPHPPIVPSRQMQILHISSPGQMTAIMTECGRPYS